MSTSALASFAQGDLVIPPANSDQSVAALDAGSDGCQGSITLTLATGK